MAKRVRQEEGGDTWLNTYADMVTLLLTFFIMLFSMSSVQEDKWQALVKAFTKTGEDTNQVLLVPDGEGNQIGKNSGVPPETISTAKGDAEAANELPIDFEELFEYLKKYVQENGMEGSVSVQKGKDQSVFIRFQNSVLFNADSFTLLPKSKEMLDFLGNGLKSVEDQIQAININGHTANIPGYPVSDRMLSSQRAASVAMYLEDTKEIDRSVILSIGNGNSHPIDDNDTPEGRSHNRRVDMLIVGKESSLSKGSSILQALQGTFDDSLYPKSGTSDDMLFPDDPKTTEEDATATDPAVVPTTDPAATPATDPAAAPTTDPATAPATTPPAADTSTAADTPAQTPAP